MSKVSDIMLAYHNAKWAAIFGLGYLAARNPRLAAKVGWELGKVLVRSALRDAGAVTRIIWKDLAKPVLTKDALILQRASAMELSQLIALGPVFGSTIFLCTGGGVVNNINQAVEWLGLPSPGEEPGNLAV